MSNRCLICFCLFGFIVSLSGCFGNGMRVNKVQGSVQWDGKPVAGATVTFFPAVDGPNAYMAFGTTDEEGNYLLTTQASEFGTGAVAGPYNVTIAKIPPGASGRPSKTSLLPGIYAETSSSPLKVEVVSGKNQLDFTLEGKGPAKVAINPRALVPTGPPPGAPKPD